MLEYAAQTLAYAWKQGMVLTLGLGLFFGYHLGKLR